MDAIREGFGRFVQDFLVRSDLLRVDAGAVWRSYRADCDAHAEPPMPRLEFYAELRASGLAIERKHGRNIVRGAGLRPARASTPTPTDAPATPAESAQPVADPLAQWLDANTRSGAGSTSAVDLHDAMQDRPHGPELWRKQTSAQLLRELVARGYAAEGPRLVGLELLPVKK